MPGKPYTMAEVQRIRHYASEGLSLGRTAPLVNRTRASLGALASRQKIKFRGWEDNGAPYGNHNRDPQAAREFMQKRWAKKLA